MLLDRNCAVYCCAAMTHRIARIELLAGGETFIGLLFLPPGEGPHPAIVVDGPLTSASLERTDEDWGCVGEGRDPLRGTGDLAIEERVRERAGV